MKLGRRILLVGEGNFSYSASLCVALDSGVHITATCYESEEAITQQAIARGNIQTLKENGAEVHFHVDCTRLKELFAPANKTFDQIIFNFPHCGKKAGVKRNRELLANFFCSCSEVLTDNGEVHVALCKGQGGTPADHPRREWHNSWQVVAMAACAGLILTELHSFSMDSYAGYKCTGYRSQEKPFHVDDALVHIFTRSMPLMYPATKAVGSRLRSKKVSFVVPDIFLDKISRQFLDSASHHPIRTFSEQLNVGVSRTFPVQRMDILPSRLKANDFRAALSWGTNISESNLFWLSAAEDLPVETPDCETIAPLISCCPYICEVCDSGDQGDEQEHGSSVFCLRPSLTVFFVGLCQRHDFIPEVVYALSGPVFRKCLISQWTMPVFHEAIYLCGFKKDAKASSSQAFMDAIENSVEFVFSTFLDETQINLDNELNTPASSGKLFSLTYRQQLTKGNYSIHLQTPRLGCGGNQDSRVGTMVTLELGELGCDLDISLVMLNLDTLVMLALGISDWRMLWTYDVRFINQFCSGKVRRFESFSLFPPSYVHDVSFWVTNEELFDELEFHTLVRRVSKECVTDIQLLDSFLHSETGVLSLCYRLKYQSCDKALSEVQASTMQLQLRQELQTMLQVTLR